MNKKWPIILGGFTAVTTVAYLLVPRGSGLPPPQPVSLTLTLDKVSYTVLDAPNVTVKANSVAAPILPVPNISITVSLDGAAIATLVTDTTGTITTTVQNVLTVGNHTISANSVSATAPASITFPVVTAVVVLALGLNKFLFAPQEPMTLTIVATSNNNPVANLPVTVILNGVTQKVVTTGANGSIVTTLNAPLGTGPQVVAISSAYGGSAQLTFNVQ